MNELIDNISISPLFKGVDKQDMPAMLGCVGAMEKSYAKGEYIFMKEDAVPFVGVVIEGKVQLIQEDIWGNRAILTTSGSGDLFGETFICANVSAENIKFYAASDVRVMLMPFQRVISTCSHACVFHRRLIENMMIMVAEKNLKLMEKIEITSKKSLREKILTYLSLQAQRTGGKYIEIPFARSELAEYLGAERSALSRELSRMKDEGLIDFDKNTFQIL